MITKSHRLTETKCVAVILNDNNLSKKACNMLVCDHASFVCRTIVAYAASYCQPRRDSQDLITLTCNEVTNYSCAVSIK